MVRELVLAALEQSRGEIVSGSLLAERIGVSRAAVWKAISVLRAEGVRIDSIHGEGYCLQVEDDSLTAAAVSACLHTQALGQSLCIVPSTPSTNTLLKQQYATAPHGFTVLALEQTAGRGRLGRTFCSPAGGLYMSVLLRTRLPLAQLHLITLAAAVSVCQAIEQLCDLRPGIKWVNDILLADKKLCGILTEASIEGETGAVDFAVLGIGVNLDLAASLPPEIQQIACALRQHCAGTPRRAVLAAAILDHTEANLTLLLQNDAATLLAAYRKRLCMLETKIQVLGDNAPYEAIAKDIDASGHLLVERSDGTLQTLSSGEISIRF